MEQNIITGRAARDAQPSTSRSNKEKPKASKEFTKPLNPSAAIFEPVARRTRSRPQKGNLVMMICAVLALIFGAYGKECNYTSFNHNPGFYFENSGKMSLSNEQWSIKGYINLESYWSQETNIKQLLEKMDDTCPHLNHQQYCNVTRFQLWKKFAIMTSRNEMFRSFSQKALSRKRRGVCNGIDIKNNSLQCSAGRGRLEAEKHTVKEADVITSIAKEKSLSRKRRGWANFIGAGLNIVTGVMDDDAAKKFNEQIEELKGSNSHLLKLIGNQTSLQDMTRKT